MQATKSILSRLVKDERGIQHAEEALLLALIAVAAVVATTALGTRINDVFDTATTDMVLPG